MRKTQLLFLVSLFLLAAVPAFAAFDNSHHDMRLYASVADPCFQCHGRSMSSSVADNTELGKIGALCIGRCHLGTGNVMGITSNNGLEVQPPITVSNASTTAYVTALPPLDFKVLQFGRSHGASTSNLKLASNGATTWNPTATATAWPYVSTGTLECTSCHAVHNNANAPFIWKPMQASGADLVDGFCELCHQERVEVITNAPNGNHPINVVANTTNATGRSGNNRHGRTISIQRYNASAIFDVVTPNASAMTGATATANYWNLGGHVGTTPNTGMAQWSTGGSQQVGCYTCHSVHRSDGVNAQTVVPTINSDGGITFNPLCVGCHGNATALTGSPADCTEWQVGTTAWGHPVGYNTAFGTPTHGGTAGSVTGTYTSSAGNIKFDITMRWDGTQNKHLDSAWGLSGRVLCLTCHQVHNGMGGSQCIADISKAGVSYAPGSICRLCHNGVGIPDMIDTSKGGSDTTTGANAANSHHVTRSTSIISSSPAIGTSGGTEKSLYLQYPPWRTGAGTAGDLNTSLDCPDCHVFNKTAHNW